MTGVLLIHGLVSLTGHVRAVPDRVSGDFDAANRVSGTPDVRWLLIRHHINMPRNRRFSLLAVAFCACPVFVSA